MNILIVGNGGREHALAWKVAQSPKVSKVFVAPGNAGTALEDNLENIDISMTDIPALIEFAQNHEIKLTIVGPEAPLVLGIVDQFQKVGLAIFGPSQAAAQLEGSKTFAKDFLARHRIPTATYQTFTEPNLALNYLDTQTAPIVIKADGLAAGKGVVVAMTIQEAKNAVTEMLSENRFGNAGAKIVIEEFLEGEEASFIVMVDGEHVEPMATSQDHKRVGDGDTGLNTGGMGAYSPAPVVTEQVHQKVMEQIIYPTIQGMKAEGHTYTGFLYAGLIIDQHQNPKVIEFNCRFGDPETQPIMMRLKSDLVELIEAALNQNLNQIESKWKDEAALGIVLASEGYPGDYAVNKEILGLNTQTNSKQATKIFHSGTILKEDKILTNGGRVLCVTALGKNIKEAQQNAYELAHKISWDGCFYRKDIGYRAIKS